MHNTDKLITLVSCDCDADVYHLNLLLDSLNQRVDCLGVTVKIIHRHVKPCYVENLIAKLLCDLHAECFHVVERKVDCLDLAEIKQG